MVNYHNVRSCNC